MVLVSDPSNLSMRAMLTNMRMGRAFCLGWDLGCHQRALDKEIDAE